MTEEERKEKAYATVNSFIRHYKEDFKNASSETMNNHKQFITGMIAGFNFTEIMKQRKCENYDKIYISK